MKKTTVNFSEIGTKYALKFLEYEENISWNTFFPKNCGLFPMLSKRNANG